MRFKPWYALLALSLQVHAQHILEKGLQQLTLTGASLKNGSIEITGTGNLHQNKAVSNAVTTLDEIDQVFEVTVLSADSAGNFRYGIGRQATLAGTYVEVAGTSTSSKVIINRMDNANVLFVKEYELPFKIKTGVLYRLRMGKRIRALIVELSQGTDHFLLDSLTYPSPFFGCQWGTPFIACSSGTISVASYQLTTPFNLSPRLFVYGDSFIEGNSLEQVNERYITYVKDSIGAENIAISGKGGESSTSIYPRFFSEKKWFEHSRYCLLAIGVNDMYFDTWKGNMVKYVNELKKSGIIPIIITLSPRADRKSFIAEANQWIRNAYNGAYIDLSKVVSENDTDWIPGTSFPDQVHPTPESHKKIFYRLADDAPYLFREKKAFTIDYVNESTNENIPVSIQYAANSHFKLATSGSGFPISLTPGTELYFTDINKPKSGNVYDVMLIPNRPAAPTPPVTTNGFGVIDWTYTPGFNQFADYEFSVDNGSNWLTCVEKPLRHNDQRIQIRVKATDKNFRSNALLLEQPNVANNYSMDVVQVYPNPANDKVFIQNVSGVSVLTVHTYDGKLVETIELQPGSTIFDTGSLLNGTYLLTITNVKGELKRTKMVVAHGGR